MKQLRLLRLRIEGINYYNKEVYDIDLLNTIGVKNYHEDSSVYKIAESIYLPKFIALAGVNASGKTLTASILSVFIPFYFCESDLINDVNKKFLISLFKRDKIRVSVFYTRNDKIYSVQSIISKVQIEKNIQHGEFMVDHLSPLKVGISVEDELVSSKNINRSTSRIGIYGDYDEIIKTKIDDNEFYRVKGFDEIQIRSKLSEEVKTFLRNGESISKMFDKKEKVGLFDTQIEEFSINSKNNMKLFSLDSITASDIQYLDPSIEFINEITYENESQNENNILKLKGEFYDFKFFNQSEQRLSSGQISTILSTGTIRGLRIISRAKKVLQKGGYLILDEIEVNLNTTIISDIISLFSDHETNPYNATLIFTTHYLEILDSIERNDQIFIAHRDSDFLIEVSKISEYQRRSDILISEQLSSDSFQLGTSIQYKKYLEFRRGFINEKM